MEQATPPSTQLRAYYRCTYTPAAQATKTTQQLTSKQLAYKCRDNTAHRNSDVATNTCAYRCPRCWATNICPKRSWGRTQISSWDQKFLAIWQFNPSRFLQTSIVLYKAMGPSGLGQQLPGLPLFKPNQVIRLKFVHVLCPGCKLFHLALVCPAQPLKHCLLHSSPLKQSQTKQIIQGFVWESINAFAVTWWEGVLVRLFEDQLKWGVTMGGVH